MLMHVALLILTWAASYFLVYKCYIALFLFVVMLLSAFRKTVLDLLCVVYQASGCVFYSEASFLCFSSFFFMLVRFVVVFVLFLPFTIWYFFCIVIVLFCFVSYAAILCFCKWILCFVIFQWPCGWSLWIFPLRVFRIVRTKEHFHHKLCFSVVIFLYSHGIVSGSRLDLRKEALHSPRSPGNWDFLVLSRKGEKRERRQLHALWGISDTVVAAYKCVARL